MPEIPKYLKRLRKKFPGKTPAYIEREILRNEKWQDGGDFNSHFKSYMQLLFSDMDFHEFRMQFIDAALDVMFNGKKHLCISGCTSSGKTSTAAYFLLTVASIHWENTTVYVASKNKNTAKSTIWSEVRKQYRKLKTAHSWFPGRVLSGVIELNEDPDLRTDDRAKIEVLAGENLDQLIGRKIPDPEKPGYFVAVFDECVEYPNRKALDADDNIMDNDPYLALWMGNFSDEDDILGTVMKPKGREYHDLEPDTDHIWETEMGGVALRFDGHKSPNYLAKETIYPYLIKWETFQNLRRKHGGDEKSAGYMRFARGFPVLGVDSHKILTLSQIRSHGGFRQDKTPSKPDYIFWDHTKPIKRYGFCDPSWGGDACVVGFISIRYIQNSRNPIVFFQEGCMEEIQIDGKVDEDRQNIIIANAVKAFHNKWKLDVTGFDFSMRPGISNVMVQQGFIAMGSNASASDRIVIRGQGETPDTLAKDIYENQNTEQWYFVQELVLEGRTAGWHAVEKAQRQFVRRRWEWKGKRYLIEPKLRYKRRHRESPDHADVLVGSCRVALEQGALSAPTVVHQPYNLSGSQALLHMYQKQERLEQQKPKTSRRLIRR